MDARVLEGMETLKAQGLAPEAIVRVLAANFGVDKQELRAALGIETPVGVSATTEAQAQAAMAWERAERKAQPAAACAWDHEED